MMGNEKLDFPSNKQCAAILLNKHALALRRTSARTTAKLQIEKPHLPASENLPGLHLRQPWG